MSRRLQKWGIDAYRPYSKHKKWHSADQNFRLMYGSNSSGKTYALVAEACMHVSGIYPKWFPEKNRYSSPIDVWLCLVKYDKFWDTHWKYIKQFIGPLIKKPNQKQNFIKFKNGRKVQILSYQAGTEAFESSAVPWIGLDEEPTEEILNACEARIVRVKGGQIAATITPVNDPRWFHKKLEQCKKDDRYFAIQVTMEDNKSLTERKKKEFAESLDGREYKVRFLGEPVPISGQPVFPDEKLEPHRERIEPAKQARLTWSDDSFNLEMINE